MSILSKSFSKICKIKLSSTFRPIIQSLASSFWSTVKWKIGGTNVIKTSNTALDMQ